MHAATDAEALLRLDYQQTTDLIRTLTDVRFKLLALTPTLAGATVAVFGHPGSAVQLLAVGLLGVTATLGVLLYELRNSQLYDYALDRAKRLEAELGFRGGPFTDRPDRSQRLLGIATVDRDRGFALVYSAALAGWSYLVAWGILRALEAGHARSLGAAAGVAAGLIVLADLVRLERAPRTAARRHAVTSS
jgi:hypothetical protein